MNNCLYCGKETKNPKYCNNQCSGHVAGKIGGKAVQQVLRQKKLGWYNPEHGRRNGKINGKKAQQILKEKGISAFYNREIQRQNGIKAQKTLKDKGISAFYDKNIQRKNGQKSGQIVAEILRQNSRYDWNSIKFRTKQELECAKLILITPIEGVNCNIHIGSKFIDFYPQSNDKMFQGCFVEYHPINTFFNPGETFEDYYNSRRKVLDENGYKSVKLIVIQNLKELINYGKR